jgi:hypothetical protein
VVALAEMTAELFEGVGLVFGFDAFGEGVEVECFAEAEDGVDEVGVVAAVGDVVDETFVDLDGVDGELAEVAE